MTGTDRRLAQGQPGMETAQVPWIWTLGTGNGDKVKIQTAEHADNVYRLYRKYMKQSQKHN